MSALCFYLVVDGKKDKKENLDVNVQAAAESTAEDNSVVVKMDISDTTIDNWLL